MQSKELKKEKQKAIDTIRAIILVVIVGTIVWTMLITLIVKLKETL